MANVIITFTIMPASPEIDLTTLEGNIKGKIINFAGEGEMKVVQEPVAFGIKKLMITFVADEAKGGTDDLEADIASMDEVNSCECTDVRRALG